MEKSMDNENYGHLALMVALSYISMYVLMYAMVNVFANVLPNLNQFYMAGLMTTPMIVIEITLMGMMYHNKKLNNIIIGMSVILGVIFFAMIRQQTLISDKQFLKSMIPHHASAILMCDKTPIQDPEIKELCSKIISGQQAEIDWMKAKLDILD